VKKFSLICFLLFYLLFFLLGIGLSQTGQEGKIQGTVYDDEGIPLPGATVSITSPELISPELAQVTSSSGTFRFPSLPPGTYQVTFQMPGFQTLIRKGIIVNASKTTSFNVNLIVAAIEEEVTVEGKLISG